MAHARDIAEHILRLGDAEDDLISNLKLQKLLYYAQGFALVLLGRQLFAERIEAWQHGPVVPDMYRQYKAYGSNPISHDPEFIPNLNTDERDVVDEVYAVYGQYSPWRLRELTHQEQPWTKRFPDGIITPEDMREFFSSRVAA